MTRISIEVIYDFTIRILAADLPSCGDDKDKNGL